MKIIGIYIIRNIINNHLYVGQSTNIYKRWSNHKALLNMNKHSSTHLQRSWNLHGESKFELIILRQCNMNQLTETEQYFIDLLTPEYNSCLIAGSTLGFKLSESTKLKISASNKGNPKSEHMKEALKKTWAERKQELLSYRTPMTEEEKIKRSERMSGEKNPMFGKLGEKNPNFGLKRTNETKEAIGKTHRGKILSKETKEKISTKLKGMPLSEERKLNMSKAKLRTKQSPEQIKNRVEATKKSKLKKLS